MLHVFDQGFASSFWLGLLFAFTQHPDHPGQALWLVIARRKGGSPWYLLTNEPITCVEKAWGIMFAYARRWQIELTWRENKSELAAIFSYGPQPL